MKANEFRDMTLSEISDKIRSLKEDLFSQKFKTGTGQIENTNLIKSMKRDIARGLTVLKETELVEKKKSNA
jgi:large subunit ribosomal protein L29